MQRLSVRQAVLFGLALLLVWFVGRTSWIVQAEARHAAVVATSARWVRGLVVIVDPGHGGDDPGAVVGSTREKELVLAIAQRVRETLEQAGARVVMTRERDEDLGGRIREELGRRVALVRQHNAHVYVSIHANKDSCNCWGAQTFYQRNGMPDGKALAMAIQNQLRLLTPTTRVALPADYFVLRTSPVPAAMVEVGFLTSAAEHGRLKNPEYQRTLALAVTRGISDWVRSTVPEAKAGGSIGR